MLYVLCCKTKTFTDKIDKDIMNKKRLTVFRLNLIKGMTEIDYKYCF